MNEVGDITIPPRPGFERKFSAEPEVDRAKCRRNFWWLTGFLVIWLPLTIGGMKGVGIFVPGGLVAIPMGLYATLLLGSFWLYFIQLGRLAVMNKKSWVIWALLPFMFFFIGGLVMYFKMIGLGKENRWL